MNTGDTAFMLISTALVMLMTPGLALFYGGLVRNKNVLGTMMHSFVSLGLITVVWVLWGYTFAFGPDVGGIIGGLDFLGLKGVGLAPGPYASKIPHLVFMIFQCMFAIITPALIAGAFAERIKFKSYLLFIFFWAIFVYAPLAHWIWGGGWLGNLGALDFAGGAVVHMSSGFSALAAAIIIGRRHGYGTQPYIPHNLPLTVLGAGLLWFGWFGFNAGSAFAADGIAVNAFVTTHIAASAATLSWLFAEWFHRGRPTILGAASGAVAGLVAITPGAGFVSPFAALIIGFLGGTICYSGVLLKERLHYDDALDVVGIHGIGGIWGALATGLFASKLINPNGADGLLLGNPRQLWIQFISVIVTILFVFVMSLIILKLIDMTVGLRVSEEEEIQGLDLAQHNETGYNIS